jgi:hypothetical protein
MLITFVSGTFLLFPRCRAAKLFDGGQGWREPMDPLLRDRDRPQHERQTPLQPPMNRDRRVMNRAIVWTQADPAIHYCTLRRQSRNASSTMRAGIPMLIITATASKAASGVQPANWAAAQAKSKGVGDSAGVIAAVTSVTS